MHLTRLGEMQKRHVIVHDHSHQQKRINTIEDTTVTRDQMARIFDAGSALDLRFDEVTNLGKDAEENAEDDVVGKTDVKQQADNAEEHRAGEELRDGPFHRLLGTNARKELMAAKAQSGYHRRRVAHPDGAEDGDHVAEPQVIGIGAM